MALLERRDNRCAFAGRSLNFYAPPSLSGCLGQQRQSEAYTLAGLGRVKWVKRQLYRSLIHSTAVVLDFYSHDVLFGLLEDPNLDAAGSRRQGVLGHVQQVKGNIFHGSIYNPSSVLTQKGLAQLHHTGRITRECGESRTNFI